MIEIKYLIAIVVTTIMLIVASAMIYEKVHPAHNIENEYDE